MKTVLITGASSGIGKEFAIKFASKGNDLLLVARRKELLEELKKEIENKYRVRCDYLATDISENPKAVYDYAKDHYLEIDVLVNNAGFGDYGKFVDADIDKLNQMIELNNKALVTLTYYFVKDMKFKGRGHIINVGSVASFIPGPYMAVYYASKAFVLSFSLALREELRNDNVKVSVLCPAPTKSEFWEVANGETSAVYKNILARTAKDAANTGMRIYEENKPYEIDGLPYKLLIGFARILPLEICARTIGFIQSKTKKKKGE